MSDSVRVAGLVLPTEGHIVATALAAERMRSAAANILVILQFTPRDSAALQGEMDAIQRELGNVAHSYEAYAAVLTCRGQA